jgi:glycosyltransferase involved in cell wall biosynthesis
MNCEAQNACVSVVITTRNPNQKVSDFVTNVERHLCESFEDYEVLIIDQGSKDAVASNFKNLLKRVCCLRYIKLASRVGDDVAFAAGLENAIGDFVVLMDPLADPACIVSDLVRRCRGGIDVIIGVAEQRSTFAYHLIRPLSGFILRSIGYSLPRHATMLRCLSRRAVNSVSKTGRFHHQLYMRIAKIGCIAEPFHYEQANPLERRNTLVGGLRRTAYLIVFCSTKPLRMVSLLGFAGGFLAFMSGMYSLAVNIFLNEVVEGWTTQMLFVSLMFMLQFTILAFFGEYLGRLLDEQSNRDNYDVVYEESSSVFPVQRRLNIVDSNMSDSSL